MASKLCKSCTISKSFPVNKIPKNYDFMPVNNTTSNAILDKIYESRQKLRPNNKFVILVDGSRYNIELVSSTSKPNQTFTIKQYFLHNDSKRGQLVEVSVRFVKIVC